MSITRGNLIARIRDFADADTSSRWTDPTLLAWADVAVDQEWARILNANPYTRFGTRNVTTNATGVLLGSALNAGTGDTAERWYRVLAVTPPNGGADGKEQYRPLMFQEVPTALITNWNPDAYAYYQTGDDFQVLPPQVTALVVTVNHRPPLCSSLASDNSVVVLPDSFEQCAALEAAAYALAKGGAETQATAELRALASTIRDPLLDDLSRRNARPQVMQFPDSRFDWGG